MNENKKLTDAHLQINNIRTLAFHQLATNLRSLVQAVASKLDHDNGMVRLFIRDPSDRVHSLENGEKVVSGNFSCISHVHI